MTHPYRQLPDRAFWSRGVSRGFDAAAVYEGSTPLLPAGARVVSAGSCFAANLVPYLEANGFTYIRTEALTALVGVEPQAMSYDKFSAGYGNIYTARQLRQLCERALGRFAPQEDRWHEDGMVIDPLRPGLTYPAGDDFEFEAMTRFHLDATRAAISVCDTFIFTLGLTESWVSLRDGTVFPACPGTVRGMFDPRAHGFHNFTAAETIEDLIAALGLVREINPHCRIVLTVSPVPLVATATGGHVLSATVYSKSVLRVAAAEATRALDNVVYFPAYEIITGPQAPQDYFEDNRRDPSRKGIDAVMAAFFSACGIAEPNGITAQDQPAPPPDALAALSRRIADIECEEAAADN